jgi:hypothetical protein
MGERQKLDLHQEPLHNRTRLSVTQIKIWETELGKPETTSRIAPNIPMETVVESMICCKTAQLPAEYRVPAVLRGFCDCH